MTRLAAITCAALSLLAASCSTLFQRPKDISALPVPPLQFPITEKRFGGPLPEPLTTYLADWHNESPKENLNWLSPCGFKNEPFESLSNVELLVYPFL